MDGMPVVGAVNDRQGKSRSAKRTLATENGGGPKEILFHLTDFLRVRRVEQAIFRQCPEAVAGIRQWQAPDYAKDDCQSQSHPYCRCFD